MQAKKLRWGFIATGMAARDFANGVKASAMGEPLAVGSRLQATADAFGDEHGIPRRYAGYQRLLDDPDVDAVYVSTPHPMHAEWAIKAAEAGKHVLVEKPIAMDEHETSTMIDAARRHDVFLMEAFAYRCHPQFRELASLIRQGAIGEVHLIQAAFGFCTKQDPENRYFSRKLGGGAILDIGCYTASAARLIAGVAAGKDFDDPIEVKACGQLGPTGVDAWTAACLKFAGGIVAQLSAAILVRMRRDSVIRIYGSEGMILMPTPWHPEHWGAPPGSIILHRQGDKQPREIAVQAPLDAFTYEADIVAANIHRRQAHEMSWDDSLGNMRVLDHWRREIGLHYDQDRKKSDGSFRQT